MQESRRKVFVSYSHNDADWLKRLQVHLKDLERRSLIDCWDEALSGLGGMGKTQTALEYAYRFQPDYKFVFWSRAQSRETPEVFLKTRNAPGALYSVAGREEGSSDR